MLVKGKKESMSSYTKTCKQQSSFGGKDYLYPALVIAITDFKIKYAKSKATECIFCRRLFNGIMYL